MIGPMLPLTFLDLPAGFRGVFMAPSYDNFRVLVSGFVHSLGRHGISDAIRAAGPAAHKPYSAYYRFFSRATRSLDEFGLCLLGLVIRALSLVGVEVELVLDDSLARGTGKKVALATMHADTTLPCTSRLRPTREAGVPESKESNSPTPSGGQVRIRTRLSQSRS